MLASLPDTLTAATEKAYALVIADVSDPLAAQALIAQATDQQAPLVLAVHMNRLSDLTAGGARRLADALREQARMAHGPVCLMLEGVQNLEQVEKAGWLGFCAVLLEEREADFVREAVEFAHGNGLAVVAFLAQAQAGAMPSLPDPIRTRAFIESTNPDALLVELEGAVPFSHLGALCEGLSVPLLLRTRGTLSEGDLKRALALGVRAFDCSSVLSETLVAVLREHVSAPDFEPITLLDRRDSALRETLSTYLRRTGSAGQAPCQPVDIPTYAEQLFTQGYSCAESVFTAFAETEGYSSEVAHRAATSFIGGMARQGLTCGALIGGLMVIGAREAHSNPQYKPPRYAARAMAAELVRWYQTQKGTTNCRDLLQLDLSDPEQARQYSAERHLHGICIPLVREVSEWLIARFNRQAGELDT
jgi:C_GCAxxG_C_C family probable redox protein